MMKIFSQQQENFIQKLGRWWIMFIFYAKPFCICLALLLTSLKKTYFFQHKCLENITICFMKRKNSTRFKLKNPNYLIWKTFWFLKTNSCKKKHRNSLFPIKIWKKFAFGFAKNLSFLHYKSVKILFVRD